MGPAVDRLARRVQRLTRLAAALQELSVDVAEELSIIRRTLKADASGRLDAAIECALLRRAHARHHSELAMSAKGAWRIDWRWHAAGAALVRVDEGKWFRLSRGDAQLLRMLAGAAADRDGFAGWQTCTEVVAQLGAKSGATPTRRALTQSIYRLRRALEAADLNPFLIRVDSTRGRVRLLLREPDGATPRGATLVRDA